LSAHALPRVIGASSLLNALFVVAAALLGALGRARGLGVPRLIAVASLMNAAVALYIYHLVPEFLLRFVCWVLVHVLYRLRPGDVHGFPGSGAALIVSNHVTFVDALVISAACRRPVHFIMDEAIFNAPIIRTLARGMKAIPIASARDDREVLERAFALTARALRDGELVCIFPEGRLTRDGLIGEFRPGMMRILAETPVAVIPIAIVGLWGSMFSKQAPRVWQRLPRKLGARIAVNVGAAIAAEDASPEGLRRSVQAQYARGTAGDGWHDTGRGG
jgi:1-acyl-sn-glycerol-3-phosphate acyltransferase